MEQLVSKLNPKHPDYATYASALKQMCQDKDFGSVAQTITGLIQAQILLEDPIPQLVDEFQWQDATGKEQVFYAPVKIHNNTATVMLPGMTLGVAKITQNKVWVQFEEITTPAYDVDTRDLAKGDVVDIDKIKNFGMNALITAKVLRFYMLTCSGSEMTDLDDPNSRIILVEDDGTFTYQDTPKYVPLLKRLIEDNVATLQEQLNVSVLQGGSIKGFCRQITANLLNRAQTTGVSFVTIPAAEDYDTNRTYFTEGDVVVFSPFALNVARIEDVETSTYQKDHYTISFAYRWAHKWIRWDTKYIRRFLIMKNPYVLDNTKASWGTIAVDAIDMNGMSMYFDRPVRKASICAANFKLEASTDGGSTWSEVVGPIATVDVGYDMRHVRITWTNAAVTAGKKYRISNQTGKNFYDAYGNFSGHLFPTMVAANYVYSV